MDGTDLRSHDRTPTDGREAQYLRVLRLLRDHRWHGTLELLDAGGHRFSDCVYVLRRKHGHVIDTRQSSALGERYEYRLRRVGEGAPPDLPMTQPDLWEGE